MLVKNSAIRMNIWKLVIVVSVVQEEDVRQEVILMKHQLNQHQVNMRGTEIKAYYDNNHNGVFDEVTN